MNKCPYTLFCKITQKIRGVSSEISQDDPKFKTYQKIADYLQEIFPQSFFDQIFLEVEHMDESGRIIGIDLDEDVKGLGEDVIKLTKFRILGSNFARKIYYLNERCDHAVMKFFKMQNSKNPYDYKLAGVGGDSDFSAAIQGGMGTFFHEFLFCISGFAYVGAKNGPIMVSDITAIHGERESIEKTLRMSGFLSRSNIQFLPSNYIFDPSSGVLTRVNGDTEPKKNDAVGCPAIRKFSGGDEPVFHRFFNALWKVAISELPIKSHTSVVEMISAQVHRGV